MDHIPSHDVGALDDGGPGAPVAWKQARRAEGGRPSYLATTADGVTLVVEPEHGFRWQPIVSSVDGPSWLLPETPPRKKPGPPPSRRLLT